MSQLISWMVRRLRFYECLDYLIKMQLHVYSPGLTPSVLKKYLADWVFDLQQNDMLISRGLGAALLYHGVPPILTLDICCHLAIQIKVCVSDIRLIMDHLDKYSLIIEADNINGNISLRGIIKGAREEIPKIPRDIINEVSMSYIATVILIPADSLSEARKNDPESNDRKHLGSLYEQYIKIL